MLSKLFKGMAAQKHHDQLGKIYRALMHNEARMGGQLFGPVPANVRREFFCLDDHTWIWHEEWTDKNGEQQIITTRYDVRPTGILKAQNNHQYQQVSSEEAQHLLQAAKQYLQRARHEIYHIS
jgi:hypothetical protein